MKLWIARDEDDGMLFLHELEPIRDDPWGFFMSNGKTWDIDKALFPEVTWQNSPQQVELKLIIDKE